MDLRFTEFNETTTSIGVNNNVKLLSYGLAFALGTIFPVPSSPVDSAGSHVLQYQLEAGRLISAFNEETVVDYKTVYDVWTKFWTMRYNAVHNADLGYSELDKCVSQCFTGEFLLFSIDEQEFMKANIANLTIVKKAAIGLISKINATT